jgi:hypothetical protein
MFLTLKNKKGFEITKPVECLLTEKGTITSVFFYANPRSA